MIDSCPVCRGSAVAPILGVDRVPVFNNVLFESAERAQDAPTGRIDLVTCESCGLIYNRAFDPAVVEYTPDYANSLHHSAVFRDSTRLMAERLAAHTSEGATVVEIGCGTAEFLAVVTDLVHGPGVGFDPSLDPAHAAHDERLDLHESAFEPPLPDGTELVICRQVLEHLREPRLLLRDVRDSLCGDATFYVDVPDASYMIDERSYLDVIYEHPLYFRGAALATLARSEGFRVDDTGRYFGGQYLWADLGPGPPTSPADGRCDEDWLNAATDFGANLRRTIDRWSTEIVELQKRGPVIVWGAGSKGISLLSLVHSPDCLATVADINPVKQGRYTPVTGHAIVGPQSLPDIHPATILATNRNYVGEIRSTLHDLDVDAAVVAI